MKISEYNNSQIPELNIICEKLCALISSELFEANGKIWHAHPVWFINENPIVGYSIQKKGVRLMFWSGADFVNHRATVFGKKFKDASIFYNHIFEVNDALLISWLQSSKNIQWDYKNIVKRKGILERLC